MRIDWLSVRNFKGFIETTLNFPRDPDAPAASNGSFHLIVGENGTGKTSALDALAVAAGSWLLGIKDFDSRHIQNEDIRLKEVIYPDTVRFERQFPVTVEAGGVVLGREMRWMRVRDAWKKRTTWKNASIIKDAAEDAGARARKGEDVTLPVVSYYGTGRLWQEPKDMRHGALAGARPPNPSFDDSLAFGEHPYDGSRLEGYRFSVDPRCDPRTWIRWLHREKQVTIEQGHESVQSRVVREAIRQCLEGCRDVDFSLKHRTLVVESETFGSLPFSSLSDGQRTIVGLVGDLAYKAAQLNPHLGTEALRRTPGIVLIDEIDLHLHPRWQRHVVGDLRRTFPEVQFIATSHAPAILSEVQPYSLILLQQGEGRLEVRKGEQAYGLDANWILDVLMGVPSRPQAVADILRDVESWLERADVDAARDRLGELTRVLHGPDEAVSRLEARIGYLESLAADETD